MRRRLAAVLVVLAGIGATMPAEPAVAGGPTVSVVTTTRDGPPEECTPADCTLREAIEASHEPGPGRIVFDIPGEGPHTIRVAAGLRPSFPSLRAPVVLDGTTQPGYDGTPEIEINLANAGDLTVGQPEAGATDQTVVIRGLALNRANDAISALFADGAVRVMVERVFIGTDPSGTVAFRNSGIGIHAGGPGLRLLVVRDSIVSGNRTEGIDATAQNGRIVLVGNRIGTDRTGTSSIENIFHGFSFFEVRTPWSPTT